MDLVAIKWHTVRILGFGPEIMHGESTIEVGSKVVHDSDRKHDVHAELERVVRSGGVSVDG